VPDFCTCGVELVPGALFCHKCGKPQREDLLAGPEPAAIQEPPVAAMPVRAATPEISFRNSLAVRTGFLVGALAFLLSSLPLPPPAGMIWLVGAGFLSVFLYRRRSGQPLTVGGGARMGWITGLWCFVLFTVIFTLSFAAVSFLFHEGGAATYFAQLRALGMPEDNLKKIEEAIRFFESPSRVVAFLLSFFVMHTGLVTLGGAIGARLLRGQSR